MRYLQQQQSQNQPPVLLHVLHAKVDVRLLDALGAPSSKYEAVQRVLTEQQSSLADSDSSSSQSTHNTKYNKTTLEKTPSKSTTVRTPWKIVYWQKIPTFWAIRRSQRA